ncbi:MAG: DUF3365 domain-containing protein [Bacteroidia bacterium]|nr:DUF3365 domain-containing protein [Bacteroidia bacterium]
MIKNIFLLLILLLGLSCKQSGSIKQDLSMVSIDSEDHNLHPGKKLLETYCYVCHNPTTAHDDRIAPPMIAVKKHYLTDGVSKEEFISSMQSWIKDPSEENAKMRGAVRRFGVMPKAHYPEKDIKLIADYLYDNKIEEPEWFEDQFNKGHGQQGMGRGQGFGNGQGKRTRQGQQIHQNQTAKKTNSEIGLHYALTTKKVLGKNLMGTIQKKGTIEALKFCNERAYPLTDSMSVVHNANIKRASDKPRNPKNKANTIELEYINVFKDLLKEEKEIEPIVVTQGNQQQFYYPIVTNSMCLQCHGENGNQLKTETYQNIKDLYPKDLATGYDVNQVRGIWSITFNKDNE